MNDHLARTSQTNGHGFKSQQKKSKALKVEIDLHLLSSLYFKSQFAK